MFGILEAVDTWLVQPGASPLASHTWAGFKSHQAARIDTRISFLKNKHQNHCWVYGISKNTFEVANVSNDTKWHEIKTHICFWMILDDFHYLFIHVCLPIDNTKEHVLGGTTRDLGLVLHCLGCCLDLLLGPFFDSKSGGNKYNI